MRQSNRSRSNSDIDLIQAIDPSTYLVFFVTRTARKMSQNRGSVNAGGAMRAIIRICACIGTVATLAACTLPRGAAIESEIIKNAELENGEFAVYPVTRDRLPHYAQWPATGVSDFGNWIAATPGSRGQIIAPGDIVQISVWENNENSLLTSVGEPSASVQDTPVSASGEVFVPYVGNLRIAGMSPTHAREVIQEELEMIAPSGQVQLSVIPGRQNSVDLVSGARQPGNFPLTDRTLSVLNLISLGGGVDPALQNPRVVLLRGGNRYVTLLENLFDSPRYDTTLIAGDKVVLEEDERYFLALGATGQETLIPFRSAQITALEAMVQVGGVSDTRGNPQGVLILREYGEGDLDPMERRGPNNVRTIFTVDLTSADGLFSAGKFQIQPNDLVLVTESPITSTHTILGLIGRMVGISNALE